MFGLQGRRHPGRPLPARPPLGRGDCLVPARWGRQHPGLPRPPGWPSRLLRGYTRRTRHARRRRRRCRSMRCRWRWRPPRGGLWTTSARRSARTAWSPRGSPPPPWRASVRRRPVGRPPDILLWAPMVAALQSTSPRSGWGSGRLHCGEVEPRRGCRWPLVPAVYAPCGPSTRSACTACAARC